MATFEAENPAVLVHTWLEFELLLDKYIPLAKQAYRHNFWIYLPGTKIDWIYLQRYRVSD